MVEAEVIERIEADIPGARVRASGDGSRMDIQVVAEAFEGLPRVKRELMVNASIREMIKAGALHAVSIRALTPSDAGETP